MLKNIRQIFRDLRITPAAGAMFIQGQLKSVHWRGAPESERHRAATDFKSEIFKFSLNPIKSTPFVESEKKILKLFKAASLCTFRHSYSTMLYLFTKVTNLRRIET